MRELTPTQIVNELDKYIIGQDDAKRSVAIALRNRWRRRRVEGPIRDEILPANIIMHGPTGVGKTEVARRLARLAQAPFIKVEATKYTEVGYVGRDVESMIRDLVEIAINMEKEGAYAEVEARARRNADDRLLEMLLPRASATTDGEDADTLEERRGRTKEKLRQKLEAGALDAREVTIETTDRPKPFIEIFSSSGLEEMGVSLPPGLEKMMPTTKKGRKVTVDEARRLLVEEEKEKLVDMDRVVSRAVKTVEESGIVFIDEIDKIAGAGSGHGPDVSREGVQRDILPVVEGCNVNTKHGVVKTDHILFIAAGAFHTSKPSDLVPELQGRFPIRVEFKALTAEDFERILLEPENALIKQYAALVAADGCEIEFTAGAVREIAQTAFLVNRKMENIGARRLHTIMTTLLEDILFELPESHAGRLSIDETTVREKLERIVKDDDLARFVL
ncbi:MAG: ATP-dependent protease ATPase subunit HslU [Candidatus Krumholzibacteriota bacterium]|nr:ATP-dependent protease ATPase subunit HslU [Candidatus Krumholzibacteriota bacterium]